MKKTILSVVCALMVLVASVPAFSIQTFAAEPNNYKQQNDSDKSAEMIYELAQKEAGCEKRLQDCVVRIARDHNPYDIEWNYGEEYNDFIATCDWSKVFNAEYYKKTFPILAKLYNYDDELLLEHFQTVGIHEGRQGSADFNCAAYADNCDEEIRDLYQNCVAGYYLYYLTNYETEKNINTVTKADGSTPGKQLSNVLSANQKNELKAINKYRADVDAAAVEALGEMNAFANYRAYVNRTVIKNKLNDDRGHEWARNHQAEIIEAMNIAVGVNIDTFFENTVTSSSSIKSDYAYKYYSSKEHYEAMVNPGNTYTGISNSYCLDGLSSQFDIYVVS